LAGSRFFSGRAAHGSPVNMGLRTTIFWNMALVMLIALGLIAVVVFRVTEQELYRQAGRQHRQVFDLLAADIALGGAPTAPAGPGLREERLLQAAVARHLCRAVALADAGGTVIARAGAAQQPGDAAPGRGEAVQGVTSVISPGGAQLLSGPVQAQGRTIGFLTMTFSLAEARSRIGQAFKTVVLYSVLNAMVLTAIGTLLLTRYVVRPLKRVIRLTETIAEGQSKVPLFFSHKNEIGKLAAALNAMSDNLQIERRRVQQQLRELEDTNRELQAANREILHNAKLASVGRLAAGIAHEIGNPAGIILGYIHLLRRPDVRGSEREEYLARMEAETERVSRTVRDLMAYAQPAAREKTNVDLNAVVQDAWAMVACQEGFEGIRPVFRCADNLPPLLADGHQIRQMLINLMLNARDAMNGAGTLELGTAPDPRGGIRLTVSDTGGGVAEDMHERIFEPFFTTKRRGANAGLGLANVQRIVVEAGGTITLSSTPGRGATFAIRFPAAADAAER
jgi:signal transduction histidine kinase